MIKIKKITLETKGFTDVINITPEIEEFVESLEIKEGAVTIFVKGSTGAVTTIEHEPNLIKDFKEAIESIAPSDIDYKHTNTWDDDNGYSHVRASIIGCSKTVPVMGGALVLGTWQQVIVVDFDTRPRKREVILICTFKE